MKVAVPFEDGKVFQHFGHCESFKIYSIEENEIVSSEVISAGVSGHDALAGMMAEMGIDVVICGGIGPGAVDALSSAGITVFSGFEGEADAAVDAMLNGELSNTGSTCDHHEQEESEGGCGGGCSSGGCGGCHGCKPQIILEGPNAGKTLKVHYRGTFNDGTQFDSSYDRGETLDFVCGAGMMIRGFDIACLTMVPGETKNIHIMPADAYGEIEPAAIRTFKIAELPGSEGLTVGQQVYMQNSYGQPFPVKVTAKDDENITLDANHEMAGKELNFEITLVEIAD